MDWTKLQRRLAEARVIPDQEIKAAMFMMVVIALRFIIQIIF